MNCFFFKDLFLVPFPAIWMNCNLYQNIDQELN